MAQQDRRISTFWRHAGVGLLVGVVVGTFVAGIGFALVPRQFEAESIVFHGASEGTPDSARDYFSSVFSRPGYLQEFIDAREVSEFTVAQLTRNLTVTAEDASWPVAAIRLRGGDAKVLEKTLDSLTDYTVGVLRENQRTDDQDRLRAIVPAIDALKKQRDEQLAARAGDRPLSNVARRNIQQITVLVDRRLEFEAAERFLPQVRSTADQFERRERLADLITQEKHLLARADDLKGVDREYYDAELALALVIAELGVMERIRQRLDERSERSQPMRVVKPADTTVLKKDYSPVFAMFAFCLLIGGIAGGVVWSKKQTGSGLLSADLIEQRHKVPVLGVIAKALIDDSLESGRPVALVSPERLDVAGVRSLAVAHFFQRSARDAQGPTVLTDIRGAGHVQPVVANLSSFLSRQGLRTLVIDGTKGGLSASFGNESVVTQHESLESLGSVVATQREKNTTAQIHVVPINSSKRLVATEVHDAFDVVLVAAPRIRDASVFLKQNDGCFGVLICPPETRISVLRKALSMGLNSVVLCPYTVDSSAYPTRSSNPPA